MPKQIISLPERLNLWMPTWIDLHTTRCDFPNPVPMALGQDEGVSEIGSRANPPVVVIELEPPNHMPLQKARSSFKSREVIASMLVSSFNVA